MAGKEKKYAPECPRGALSWGEEGKWSERHGRTLEGAKFLKHHSLILRPLFLKSTFDPNHFTLSSMFSFQNVWPIKRKAVYTLLLDWIGSQLGYFFKLLT